MSDDNLIDFGKVLNESKSDNAETVEGRVVQCMDNNSKGECECMYCKYRNNAAEMVVDFLSRDMITFEKNAGARFCTFDLKDIFFKAIMEIKKMEKEPDNGEKES